MAISKLDEEIKARKEKLLVETNIKELEAKKQIWYEEVELLGNVMQEVYGYREIKNGLSYLDAEKEESYLVKRGEYLSVEFSSA